MPRAGCRRPQEDRLLKRNAFRCCVCKRPQPGLILHPIDGDPSNADNPNLAVLCVEDHDKQFRPIQNPANPNHLELGGRELARFKISWEAFVAEAAKEHPGVVATLAAYGTDQEVHSVQLVVQWLDKRIEYDRTFHLLGRGLDPILETVRQEASAIGPGVKMSVTVKPLPVERCACCAADSGGEILKAVAARLGDPLWATESVASISINPNQPFLKIGFSLGPARLFEGGLHLCGDSYLHYSGPGVDERIPMGSKPSVRRQASRVIDHILSEWHPARVQIGAGNPGKPRLASIYWLPKIWSGGSD